MAGRGPTGSDQPVRRNVRVSAVKLPAEGRKGAPPPWPLRPDPKLTIRVKVLREEQADLERLIEESDDTKELNRLRYRLGQNVERLALAEALLEESASLEAELWREVWATPQAVAWERLRWTREVAQYVRWKAAGELGDMDAAKEARMWSDRLGLSPLAMKSLRWEIVANEVAEKAKQKAAGTARGRIKAV